MSAIDRVHEFLARGLSGFPWRIVISDWQDRTYAIGGDREHWCGQPLQIRFNNERGIRDVLGLNGQGVLEDFVRGDVDMSGNLYVLSQIEKYLDLRSTRWRLLGTLVRNRFAQTIDRAKVNVRSHYDIPQAVLRCYLDRTYMSYSCAMFEEPTQLERAELTQAGQGQGDAFDSLEKGQWRKFKDGVEFIDPSRGDTLLYGFTVEDPTVWTAPWSGEYAWPASDNKVYEYACHEANYSFGGILRGARVLEEDARIAAGRIPHLSRPFKLSRTPGWTTRHAPMLGEHTEEVLRDVAGLSESEIADLDALGVTRNVPDGAVGR